MNNSILKDVKKVIGVSYEENTFDPEIVIHINSVLFELEQMGIGKKNYSIEEGYRDTWADFVQDQQINLKAVKSYVGIKVRTMFDPPTSSLVSEALKEHLRELEWRMFITENYIGEI